ncbi:MAG TPA: sortase, partial [Anaerolineae bacterium]|nr:sortase [Anaerolineae bacterium]
NTASDTNTANAQADLSVTKDDGLTVVAPGATVTYTITVRNAGPSDALNATVSDAKPTQIASWEWTCTATGGATCSGSAGPITSNFTDTVDLPAGSSITYTVTASIASSATGDLTNTVSVATPAGVTDPTPVNDSAGDTDRILATGTGDLTKTLVATNQTFTTGTQVAIGEILTYEVTFIVPAGGTLSNLTLTDILDRGLVFVACENIAASAGITTTLPGGFADACSAPTNPTVHTEPTGSANPADAGRKVVFDLGTVSNPSAGDGTVTIRYTVVVLDNVENQSGVSLTNRATLTWGGGSLTVSAPQVRIQEPDLSLGKAATPTVVLPDEPITFTLTVQHTAQSETNAYDVVLTDVLPRQMTYVAASLASVDGPTPTSMGYDPLTRTITVTWDTFPLDATAHITFQATLDTVPGDRVTNEASLAWSSLPGDVTTPQSPYNALSTERFYDPASPADIYGTTSTAEVRMALPETGFAPGRVTPLPVQQVPYSGLDGLVLEIPKLGVRVPIVGVPRTEAGWDLTWLWDNVGWLEGTAFPTWAGNTGLTAHNYLPDGQPGPFAHLYDLRWGDQIIIHASGQRYIYEVRHVRLVAPNDTSVLGHKERDWLTLITCHTYDEARQAYRYRVIVQAVLVAVEAGP